MERLLLSDLRLGLDKDDTYIAEYSEMYAVNHQYTDSEGFSHNMFYKTGDGVPLTTGEILPIEDANTKGRIRIDNTDIATDFMVNFVQEQNAKIIRMLGEWTYLYLKENENNYILGLRKPTPGWTEKPDLDPGIRGEVIYKREHFQVDILHSSTINRTLIAFAETSAENIKVTLYDTAPLDLEADPASETGYRLLNVPGFTSSKITVLEDSQFPIPQSATVYMSDIPPQFRIDAFVESPPDWIRNTITLGPAPTNVKVTAFFGYQPEFSIDVIKQVSALTDIDTVYADFIVIPEDAEPTSSRINTYSDAYVYIPPYTETPRVWQDCTVTMQTFVLTVTEEPDPEHPDETIWVTTPEYTAAYTFSAGEYYYINSPGYPSGSNPVPSDPVPAVHNLFQNTSGEAITVTSVYDLQAALQETKLVPVAYRNFDSSTVNHSGDIIVFQGRYYRYSSPHPAYQKYFSPLGYRFRINKNDLTDVHRYSVSSDGSTWSWGVVNRDQITDGCLITAENVQYILNINGSGINYTTYHQCYHYYRSDVLPNLNIQITLQKWTGLTYISSGFIPTSFTGIVYNGDYYLGSQVQDQKYIAGNTIPTPFQYTIWNGYDWETITLDSIPSTVFIEKSDGNLYSYNGAGWIKSNLYYTPLDEFTINVPGDKGFRYTFNGWTSSAFTVVNNDIVFILDKYYRYTTGNGLTRIADRYLENPALLTAPYADLPIQCVTPNGIIETLYTLAPGDIVKNGNTLQYFDTDGLHPFTFVFIPQLEPFTVGASYPAKGFNGYEWRDVPNYQFQNSTQYYYRNELYTANHTTTPSLWYRNEQYVRYSGIYTVISYRIDEELISDGISSWRIIDGEVVENRFFYKTIEPSARYFRWTGIQWVSSSVSELRATDTLYNVQTGICYTFNSLNGQWQELVDCIVVFVQIQRIVSLKGLSMTSGFLYLNNTFDGVDSFKAGIFKNSLIKVGSGDQPNQLVLCWTASDIRKCVNIAVTYTGDMYHNILSGVKTVIRFFGSVTMDGRIIGEGIPAALLLKNNMIDFCTPKSVTGSQNLTVPSNGTYYKWDLDAKISYYPNGISGQDFPDVVRYTPYNNQSPVNLLHSMYTVQMSGGGLFPGWTAMTWDSRKEARYDKDGNFIGYRYFHTYIRDNTVVSEAAVADFNAVEKFKYPSFSYSYYIEGTTVYWILPVYDPQKDMTQYAFSCGTPTKVEAQGLVLGFEYDSGVWKAIITESYLIENKSNDINLNTRLFYSNQKELKNNGGILKVPAFASKNNTLFGYAESVLYLYQLNGVITTNSKRIAIPQTKDVNGAYQLYEATLTQSIISVQINEFSKVFGAMYTLGAVNDQFLTHTKHYGCLYTKPHLSYVYTIKPKPGEDRPGLYANNTRVTFTNLLKQILLAPLEININSSKYVQGVYALGTVVLDMMQILSEVVSDKPDSVMFSIRVDKTEVKDKAYNFDYPYTQDKNDGLTYSIDPYTIPASAMAVNRMAWIHRGIIGNEVSVISFLGVNISGYGSITNESYYQSGSNVYIIKNEYVIKVSDTSDMVYAQIRNLLVIKKLYSGVFSTNILKYSILLDKNSDPAIPGKCTFITGFNGYPGGFYFNQSYTITVDEYKTGMLGMVNNTYNCSLGRLLGRYCFNNSILSPAFPIAIYGTIQGPSFVPYKIQKHTINDKIYYDIFDIAMYAGINNEPCEYLNSVNGKGEVYHDEAYHGSVYTVDTNTALEPSGILSRFINYNDYQSSFIDDRVTKLTYRTPYIITLSSNILSSLQNIDTLFTILGQMKAVDNNEIYTVEYVNGVPELKGVAFYNPLVLFGTSNEAAFFISRNSKKIFMYDAGNTFNIVQDLDRLTDADLMFFDKQNVLYCLSEKNFLFKFNEKVYYFYTAAGFQFTENIPIEAMGLKNIQMYAASAHNVMYDGYLNKYLTTAKFYKEGYHYFDFILETGYFTVARDAYCTFDAIDITIVQTETMKILSNKTISLGLSIYATYYDKPNEKVLDRELKVPKALFHNGVFKRRLSIKTDPAAGFKVKIESKDYLNIQVLAQLTPASGDVIIKEWEGSYQ